VMRAWISIHNRRTTQKSAFAGRNVQNTTAKRHEIPTKKSPFAARTFENQSNPVSQPAAVAVSISPVQFQQPSVKWKFR
jgi:hypothetical protein